MIEYFYFRVNKPNKKNEIRVSHQERTLRKYANTYNISLDDNNVYKDISPGYKEWVRLNKIIRAGDKLIICNISDISEDPQTACKMYMELMDREINIIIIENPQLNTEYLKRMSYIAEDYKLLTKSNIQKAIKLLIYTELDCVMQDKQHRSEKIKAGLLKADKKPGREAGTMDKFDIPGLKEDLAIYMHDGSMQLIEIMRKYDISRNTLKSYIKHMRDNEKIE